MSSTSVPSVQVRANLEDLLERDLLGPWGGPDEELEPGQSPAAQYLLGRLTPYRGAGAQHPFGSGHAPPDGGPDGADAEDFMDPTLVDEDQGMDADGPGPENASAAGTVSGSMASTALGLSFAVARDTLTVRVEAGWGRYRRTMSQVRETPTGRPSMVWKRTPEGGVVELDVSVEGTGTCEVPGHEGVEVTWTVRHREYGRGEVRHVHVALVNRLPWLDDHVDQNRLYQAVLTVTALDGNAAIFLGHNDPDLRPPKLSGDGERDLLSLLYRRRRQFATGQACAVDVHRHDDERRAWRLRTTSFPAAEVRPVLPTAIAGLVTDMSRLGSRDLGGDEVADCLAPLVTGYRAWLTSQASRLDELAGDDADLRDHLDTARLALDQAHEIADRLDRAIALIRTDARAREAFRFANQAMAMQRVAGEVVRRRHTDQAKPYKALLRELDRPENRSWRPFQLAFFLLCLPGLTDPQHPDAHRTGPDAHAQLLFFPTGGGKTEAYLGLTAYTLAIRRLQGVVGTGADARDGTDGVAVLMRYTLRLLTAQQFQRAAGLIAACELLRREALAGGDTRWGTTPFRLGLWVGQNVTPNTYEKAAEQVEDAVAGQRAGVRQLVSCPYCGRHLTGAELQTDRVRRRVLLFCGDPDGQCPFSRARTDEGIPVLTVDEEIYRLTPSLLISTVDKFAQLPWKAGTAPLFGMLDSRCARHGWRTPDTEKFCRTKHPATRGFPAVQAESALRLRPPDLIIQDELHLITDALGSIVGLYETVIDRLSTRPDGNLGIRPMLVASTATVRRAVDQVRAVFDRGLTIFPPQVIDADETYFSHTKAPSPQTPGRRYRGICTPGLRMKTLSIRVWSAVLEHAQYEFDAYGASADPYMTVVGYFTSTRQLSSHRRSIEDDVAERLRDFNARTPRPAPAITELTARMPSNVITDTLGELERPFRPQQHSTVGRANHRAALKDAAAEDRERLLTELKERPVDVLLATSMLQVGVDVPRLGLMIVNGQPKNTAEYLQATSRVGRGSGMPGLVLTVFQWARPRDLAHYESFGFDHETFGLRIEGVTTTPFSDRALDRGLTGVLVTSIRHALMTNLPNTGAKTADLSGPVVAELLTAMRDRVAHVTGDDQWAHSVVEQVQGRLDDWQRKRAQVMLGYEAADGVEPLLETPTGDRWRPWMVPMSLRDVEPEIHLQITQDGSLPNAPTWDYLPTTAGGQ